MSKRVRDLDEGFLDAEDGVVFEIRRLVSHFPLEHVSFRAGTPEAIAQLEPVVCLWLVRFQP